MKTRLLPLILASALPVCGQGLSGYPDHPFADMDAADLMLIEDVTPNATQKVTVDTLRDWFFANGATAAATDLSLTATSGQDIVLTLGDAVGTNKLSIRDSSSVEVAWINSDGDMSVTDTTTNTLFWNEKAANGTPGEGKGEVWVRNTTPSTLFYTNDDNTDFQVATLTGTETLTNKTIDAAATGNVIKMKGYIYLTHPHYVDGTGATLTTTTTSANYGHATFSNSADQAGNYVEYQFMVPEDIDTAVVLRGRLKFVLGGADTATHRYVLSMASVADSAVPTAATLVNAINIDQAGDAAGASGDVETTAWTTLTSWAGSLTAGQVFRIRLARDGDAAEDASTVNSTERGLVIEYGVTQ